jgi:ketosteroid isomerase-like protein
MVLLATVASAQSEQSSNEKIIRNYFGGFVKKDWNQVAAQLDENFTFTSPAPDDHINTDQFRKKCWPQAAQIKDFEFVKIVDLGDEVIAVMHVITTDSKVLRNIEYFNFKDGRIVSIEVFFGGTGAGFPTNAK